VTSAASVGGDERLRLFLALRLPEHVLDGLAEWQRRCLRDVRAVGRDDLHLTLAFLGHRPSSELAGILRELHAAAAAAAPDLRLAPARYRETRSAGMLVLADEGGRVTAVARDVQARLQRLGVFAPEKRPWLPHVTVARFRRQPRLRLEPPALEPFAPSDAAAYLSRLRPTGAQYEVLGSVALGGR
jgi:RNA 2',3'-cyclic 3'-phosphodiesterase